MADVILRNEDWSSGPVLVATTFWQRWRGLKSFEAVLMRTRTVHGIGMPAPFRAIGLSAGFEVKVDRVVEPGEVAAFAGCSYVLELPMSTEAPLVGSKLEVVDV